MKRLQMRTAKAVVERKWNKVKALQWLLTHSMSAKLLAVKRVSSNKGAKTPGIDGEIWTDPASRMQGALSLKRLGYGTLPLRRIYIPKKNNGKRPLGIPVMRDRAQQALYLLALEPVAELTADPNSYGFRPYRAAVTPSDSASVAYMEEKKALSNLTWYTPRGHRLAYFGQYGAGRHGSCDQGCGCRSRPEGQLCQVC
ncbi:reverse transcriptase N-terminal domain-containing protein [Desulfogranum japonicum]|uniref:reverse transcriptase N-terminal domain-containing protein n=1 Tax=Desulfogranum japonicum TaxID=231447 RepID=UPI00040D12F1|nr:reverse transcriptase N-terminal domain-containing protein [Desulfogranum japonicum]